MYVDYGGIKMRLYLVSNNLVLDNIIYNTDESLEEKRINRPLSIEGEKLAKRISNDINVKAIYSSNYASALSTAKYVSDKENLPIYINSNLKDAMIGELGNRNIKMLRFMQERNFDYKFNMGESLNDTKIRINNVINEILEHEQEDLAIFTHKRAIMSYLLDYTEHGFNLDERLILTYNDKVIIDDAEKDVDIVVIDFENNKVKNIDVIDYN